MESTEPQLGKSIRIRRRNEVGWFILLCVLLFNEQDTSRTNAAYALFVSVGIILALFTMMSGIGAAYYALMRREYSNVFGLSGVSIVFALTILGSPRVHTLSFPAPHTEATAAAATATEYAPAAQVEQQVREQSAEQDEWERTYTEFMQRQENQFLLAPEVKTVFDARVVELIQGGMTFRDALYLSKIEAAEQH